MDVLHEILFNMQIMYSLALGVWATVMAARGASISGSFWGAIGIYALLNVGVIVVGTLLLATGFHLDDPQNRTIIYFLYMAFLIVIMPGLFSMLRGRDDRSAAIGFAVLALFNASVSMSMVARGLAVWVA